MFVSLINKSVGWDRRKYRNVSQASLECVIFSLLLYEMEQAIVMAAHQPIVSFYKKQMMIDNNSRN